MVESALPADLYGAAGVRALDRAAIAHASVSAHTLMLRAASAALRALQGEWSDLKRITVVCGQGNNAGDGYALAVLAQRSGFTVNVVQVGATDGLGETARLCFEAMLATGLRTQSAFDAIDDADVIVDALFGIGLTRPIAGEFADVIARINLADAPVLSIDMPSGINADTGFCMGTAVRAALTVTFIGLKQGLFTGDAPQYAGAIVFDDLDVPALTDESVRPSARLFEMGDVTSHLPPRVRTAHKGDNGHVLIVGGAPGYSGAARLAGEAAARAGAGLVSLATHPDVANIANSLRPELMVHAVTQATELMPLLARANVVAIGPGLGQSDWALALFAAVLSCKLPLVMDADALNLLALQPSRSDDWVLTPHPGEASRLLSTSTAEIHANRFSAATELQEKYGGVIVLKGAGSIVTDGKLPAVVRAGNPGMGSGGMGDALTGIIAGLSAQGFSIDDAARMGTCVHANAADRAALEGERGLLASDLMPHIRALVN